MANDALRKRVFFLDIVDSTGWELLKPVSVVIVYNKRKPRQSTKASSGCSPSSATVDPAPVAAVSRLSPPYDYQPANLSVGDEASTPVMDQGEPSEIQGPVRFTGDVLLDATRGLEMFKAFPEDNQIKLSDVLVQLTRHYTHWFQRSEVSVRIGSQQDFHPVEHLHSHIDRDSLQGFEIFRIPDSSLVGFDVQGGDKDQFWKFTGKQVGLTNMSFDLIPRKPQAAQLQIYVAGQGAPQAPSLLPVQIVPDVSQCSPLGDFVPASYALPDARFSIPVISPNMPMEVVGLDLVNQKAFLAGDLSRIEVRTASDSLEIDVRLADLVPSSYTGTSVAQLYDELRLLFRHVRCYRLRAESHGGPVRFAILQPPCHGILAWMNLINGEFIYCSNEDSACEDWMEVVAVSRDDVLVRSDSMVVQLRECSIVP